MSQSPDPFLSGPLCCLFLSGPLCCLLLSGPFLSVFFLFGPCSCWPMFLSGPAILWLICFSYPSGKKREKKADLLHVKPPPSFFPSSSLVFPLPSSSLLARSSSSFLLLIWLLLLPARAYIQKKVRSRTGKIKRNPQFHVVTKIP